jgi:hypothetical protein
MTKKRFIWLVTLLLVIGSVIFKLLAEYFELSHFLNMIMGGISLFCGAVAVFLFLTNGIATCQDYYDSLPD